MIGYVTIGTNDLKRSSAFWETLITEIGGNRMMETDSFIAWIGPNGSTGMGLNKPFDGKPATVGNGVMVAFELESPDHVDKMYTRAIELGASCEGPSGPRSDGFYAGYFRDLDGNKCNFYYMNMG
ncbi:VOC family protein [Kangiella sp. HZ709]|uniref:VOC family protein n=1 Tax=Kangiella sp. HZ709 TaxID=2666328 RepID=UPI0012AF6873|nr:VOC family protein [Kangiella sp. HZ709]MRX27849.1 VOC family protein [Kangiella sp. HZ709]